MHCEFVHEIWKESRRFPPRARGAPHCATGFPRVRADRLRGLQEFWKKDAFPKTSCCSSCNGLLPYYRQILNIKPRSDQNILESLKNVLAEGIGESEDLLITVSLEGKISSLGWQFPPVQFEWNPVRDICLKQSFINHSPRVVFWGGMQYEAPAHT